MFGWLKKKKPPSSSSTLGSFVRGIEHAVNSAMTMYEQTTTQYLNRHLRKDGTPEFDVVKIPGTKLVLVVPKITTTHPPDMALEEIEVKMSIRMDSAEMTSDSADEKDARHSFKVSLSAKASEGKESNVVDLTMKFKRGDPPEGISRIIEELTKTILPKDEKDAPKPLPPESDSTAGLEDPTPPAGTPAQKDTTVMLKPGEQPPEKTV
jgi:hypothetical protein